MSCGAVHDRAGCRRLRECRCGTDDRHGVVVVVCDANVESPEYVAVTVFAPTGAVLVPAAQRGQRCRARASSHRWRTSPSRWRSTGSAAVYVTDCRYVCGDGSAVAVNGADIHDVVAHRGQWPSVDEMRAVFVTLPLNPAESVTGTVMFGSVVPAAIADAGVYVHVTVCAAVAHAQSEGLVGGARRHARRQGVGDGERVRPRIRRSTRRRAPG